MELELQQKIKKGDNVKIPIPNFKTSCLLPTKLKFTNEELEFSLVAGNNTIIKYTEPYFRIYNEIDLSDLMSKINEGENLTMVIKNLGKAELLLGIIITYEKQLGNIIYANSYSDNQANFDHCLDDIETSGQLTQLIIDSESAISSVILDPIYRLRPQKARTEGSNELDLEQFSNWSNSLAIQNAKPSNRITIDFTDSELANYVKFLRFYRLKVIFADAAKNSSPKIHLICYGYKAD